jgi:hypothetical protein
MKLSTRHHPTSCLEFVVNTIDENSSPSAGEEIIRFLWKPMFHYRACKSFPLTSIISLNKFLNLISDIPLYDTI